MILLIDNYDSFVYNLARYVEELGCSSHVVRNDQISLDEIDHLKPSHIIISPGPCDPDRAGISLGVIQRFGSMIPILGVCLGHQAIGQAYGGKVVRAQSPMHGKSSLVKHEGTGLFDKVRNPLSVARYHSLIVSKENLPSELAVTAISEQNEIMGLQHKQFPVYGIQFHPESIITMQGHDLIHNFLKIG
jgi:anthranilate synthase/aminodeoxychorismate synthase-like glutamine amidotransferase